MTALLKSLQKLLCRLVGHQNKISCMDKDWKYTNDKCGRCGEILPIAYPHHKEFATRSNT